MAERVDLHTHSTASDGSDSPATLVHHARRIGLSAIALTDHDTLTGLEAARAEAASVDGLLFVPGVELSAEHPGGTMHLLGLGVCPRGSELQAVVEELRNAREQRNPKIVQTLRDLGVDMTMDDVLAEVGGERGEAARVVSRVHIASALKRKGAVRDTQEAFDRYLTKGAPAYVERHRVEPSRAIRAILDAGGDAILAHPPQLRCRNHAHLERVLRDLVDVGLTGLECYHSTHTSDQVRLYLDLAKKFGLLVSGGSDYHGGGKDNVSLGRPVVPLSMIDRDALHRWSSVA